LRSGNNAARDAKLLPTRSHPETVVPDLLFSPRSAVNPPVARKHVWARNLENIILFGVE
jgi:hypothetical protein